MMGIDFRQKRCSVIPFAPSVRGRYSTSVIRSPLLSVVHVRDFCSVHLLWLSV